MINLTLFAFFTGLHLALLQFSYFFLLLTNVTSTYITYATIVLSWMAGTLVGLLWRPLRATPALIIGVSSYYLIYYIVVNNPLSPYSLPLAAVGVAVTALWAGHFFVVMLPLFARADRLFLHENNGFLIGIIAVFVGFTTLGQRFLLWTPLLSGAGLLIHKVLLPQRAPAPRPVAFPDSGLGGEAAARGHARQVTVLAQRHIVSFAMVMVAVNVLLPGALLVQALSSGEPYWKMFRGEHNAVAWFSSVQLLLIGGVAYLNYLTCNASTESEASGASRYRWAWALVALGFLLFALDERFNIHEALRDELFRPAGVFVGISWLIDGDVGLYVFLLVGLAVAPFLLRDLRRPPLGLLLFITALFLTLPTIIIDSLRDRVLQDWEYRLFWDYTFEEVGEIWAQLLFLCSFLVVLHGRLGRLGDADSRHGVSGRVPDPNDG